MTEISIKNELQSTFIEVANSKKSNNFLGVIYRDPYVELFLIAITWASYQGIPLKNKSFSFLLGDFYINLLNFNEHNQNNQFFDCFGSDSFIPLILLWTRITTHSNTHMDNIISNMFEPQYREIWLSLLLIICINLP